MKIYSMIIYSFEWRKYDKGNQAKWRAALYKFQFDRIHRRDSRYDDYIDYRKKNNYKGKD